MLLHMDPAWQCCCTAMQLHMYPCKASLGTLCASILWHNEREHALGTLCALLARRAVRMLQQGVQCAGVQ